MNSGNVNVRIGICGAEDVRGERCSAVESSGSKFVEAVARLIGATGSLTFTTCTHLKPLEPVGGSLCDKGYEAV